MHNFTDNNDQDSHRILLKQRWNCTLHKIITETTLGIFVLLFYSPWHTNLLTFPSWFFSLQSGRTDLAMTVFIYKSIPNKIEPQGWQTIKMLIRAEQNGPCFGACSAEDGSRRLMALSIQLQTLQLCQMNGNSWNMGMVLYWVKKGIL